MSNAVTLKDVADAARVSIATASRALGGKSRVSEETSAHVAQVADRLGYRPNPFGKALREGQSRTVGVVVPVIGNPFYGAIVHELETELAQLGFDLLIADSHGEVGREHARMRMLVERRVEAIVVVPSDAIASAEALREAAERTVVVQMDRSVLDLEADFIGIDNALAMALVLEHLCQRGARSVALVATDSTTSAGRERRAAYEREVQRLDLSAQPHILREFTIEFGRGAAGELIGRGDLPDAVVCGDDLIAIGVLTALKHAGYRIPEDVLVTGFDGTMLADISDPPLTTIEQPFRELARETVAALIRRTSQRAAAPGSFRIEPSLRIAGSTE